MKRILMLMLLAPVACAPAGTDGSAVPAVRISAPDAEVRPGVEVLVSNPPAVLEGKRVGLITNHTGRDRSGTSTIDLLARSPRMRLVALFAPEHGIRGTAAEGELVSSTVDQRTGLPIHSLYGETRKPTPEMLEGVEALVFDIQDVGARQYTYVYTMAFGMQAAAEKGIPFVVLDRANPVTGTRVEGNILDPAFSTFVGMYPIASRHGMTAGELAQLFNQEFGFGAELTVVPVEGWRREMWFDQAGLEWIPPSPNLPTLQSAIHYPGTVYLEGTNLSEGRGTDHPFEQTGAPWLRAAEVAEQMNAMRLPGVRFEAVEFAVRAEAAKYGGERLPGVRLILTDRESYRPLNVVLHLIATIRRMHPEDFEWRPSHFDRLAGTDRLRQAIDEGTLPALLQEWERDAERFRQQRAPYLIYR
ncbi:MAG TPA: DUF1343 domain-containing protein [Longimicrobiaceae bacterium]|nr:DUF1343 domain-containing protein [Longimicrobiaceae bacterium]